MVDAEVEQTLREIRERVRAEVGPRADACAPREGAVAVVAAAAEEPHTNGAHAGGAASDALTRLEANLATAERAWNRLPPLLSYRAGWVARLELWLKRQIKRATHWYTWEQVNFNSAAYHALRDTRAALDAYRQQLSRLEAALDAEKASRRQAVAEFERRLAGLESAGDELSAELRSHLSALEVRIDSDEERLREAAAGIRDAAARVETLRGEQTALAEDLRAESRAGVEGLRSELRERVGHALEEQRVLFKQLSLEASERAVTQDRARRDMEARLAEITKAVNRES